MTVTTLPPVRRVLDALNARGIEPRRSSGGWVCRCPAHDDRNPSLSIHAGEDGRALLCCHAGCQTEAVVGALGLKLTDLMADRASPARRNGRTPKPAGKPPIPKWRTIEEAVSDQRPSAHWVYYDAEGDPVGIVMRFDKPDGNKVCVPFRRTLCGWAKRAMEAPRPVYNLPVVVQNPDKPVYVCEGEKCADALASCGLTATTSVGGSNVAAKTDWTPLAGREVIVLPDHDGAGEKYADDVVDISYKAGAKSVRVVRLAAAWPDLPAGGDVVDALELEGGDGSKVREAIEALAAEPEPRGDDGDDDGEDTPEPVERFEPFPVDVLPDPVRGFVTEASSAIGCDPSFVALPLLAGLAAAIGNTRRIMLKRAWTEPAIVWIANVGESGTAKSPALEAALRPVKDRQRRAMQDHAEDMKAWQADYARWEVDCAAWKKAAAKGDAGDPPEAPEKPVCPRTWTDDTTIEALVSRLQDNPRGLLMIRDELSGWFGFDRYSGGKGGGEVAKWLEAFGGRAIITDRKTSGTEYVPRAAVSVAGGIQPETLKRALGQEHRDNGLAARLLFAMPPRRPRRWTDADVGERTEAALTDVFERLYALESDADLDGQPRPRLLRLSEEAKPAWVRFVNEHGEDQFQRVGDEAAAWSKLEAYGARFALVIHLVRVAAGDPTITDPDAVDEASVAAGVVLVRWFAREARRIYGMLGETEEGAEHRALVEWIEGRGGSVTARQLAGSGPRAFRGNRESAQAALDALAEAGVRGARWEYPPPRGGRPPAPRLTLDAESPPAGLDALDTDTESPSDVPKTVLPVSASSASSADPSPSAPTPEDAEWGEL